MLYSRSLECSAKSQSLPLSNSLPWWSDLRRLNMPGRIVPSFFLQECRQTGLHPDVMMMQKDRKFAKELKDMLLSNSVVVGDDENYM